MNDPYKWLTDFFSNRKIRSPDTLEFKMPAVFERYFLIFDNYGILEDYPFDKLPEGASEQEQENRYKLERSFELKLRNSFRPLSFYKPVSLRELATLLHTDYGVDMFDHLKLSGGFMALWNLTVENLTRFIEIVRQEEPLCFYIADYGRYPKGFPHKRDEDAREKNEITDLSEYFKFQERSGMDACTYLFRKARPWCLATFEDLRVFILGCDQQTAEKLSMVEGLEYFEIPADYDLHLK